MRLGVLMVIPLGLVFFGCSSSGPKTETRPDLDAKVKLDTTKKEVGPKATPSVQQSQPNAESLDQAISMRDPVRIRKIAESNLMEDSKNSQAILALSMASHFENDDKRALGILSVAKSQDPSALMHVNYGILLERFGRFEEALSAYREGLKKNGSTSVKTTAQKRIGLLLNRLGAFEKSNQILTSIDLSDFSVEELTLTAESARHAGDKKRAQATFDRALGIDKNNPNLLVAYASFLILDLQEQEKGRNLLLKVSALGVPVGLQSELRSLMSVASEEVKK